MSSSASNTSTLNRKSLRRPDEFLMMLRRLFDGFAKKSTLVIATLLIVFVAIAAVTLYWSNQKQEEQEARNLLFHAQSSYTTEMKVLTDAQKPAADAEKKSGAKKDEAPSAAETAEESSKLIFAQLDVDAKMPQTVAGYKKVIEECPSTRSGHDASLALGTLYFNHGQYDKALPWFEKAAESAKRPLEKATAYQALGLTQENQGKPAEAVQALESALKQGYDPLKGELLLAVARNYTLQGNTEKARTTYDQVISQLPNTEYAQNAESAKSQLK